MKEDVSDTRSYDLNSLHTIRYFPVEEELTDLLANVYAYIKSNSHRQVSSIEVSWIECGWHATLVVL